MSDSYSQKTVHLLLKFLRANQETSEKKTKNACNENGIIQFQFYSVNKIPFITFSTKRTFYPSWGSNKLIKYEIENEKKVIFISFGSGKNL